MSDEKIGKFQVLETLGTGAHSTILRIRRAVDAKEYALKVVPIDSEEDKKYLDQAKHEFEIGQKLSHPNLCKVLLFETESDWRFRIKKAKLLIEYVNGKTLDQTPLLKMARILRVFEKTAAGLVHMHKNGVMHADLKPSNIMLGRGMNVKIIDYGLARCKGEVVDRLQGTPEYIAPETAVHKIINERTDIYNFGATMYRLVTLKLPPMVLASADGLQISEETFDEQLLPANEINRATPKELTELIHQCLSFNALKRPKRMSEVQGTLDRLADDAVVGMDPSELEG